MKIETDLPIEVLSALTKALKFNLTYDRTPGADKWTLSSGHGAKHAEYVGTKQAVCAFLNGYATMQLQTMQMLNDLDNAHRRLILEMRDR